MGSDVRLFELLAELGMELSINSGHLEAWVIEAGPHNYTAFMRALFAAKPRMQEVLASAEEIHFTFRRGEPIAPVTVRLVSAGEPH